jgi:uncharacterized membrane protein
MSTETRLEFVENRLEEVTTRLRRLEGRLVAEPSPEPLPPRPRSVPPRPESELGYFDRSPRATAPKKDPFSAAGFEELFGGRVLAWIGGLAILLGAVLFMAMAVGNGWIDEPTRTVIALIGSTALLVGGVWLHERKGRTEAARAAVASALAGLYATLIVATQVYDLVSPALGLAAAALVAAAGVAIAVRWSSAVVAAIGVLGALAAPIMVGAGVDDSSIAFVALALAGSVGILLWQRWDWLAASAFLVSAPQLAYWVLENDSDRLWPALTVLAAFWMLYVAAALGHELRATDRDVTFPLSSWFLLLAGAALVAGLGFFVLDRAGEDNAAVAWIIGLSVAHVGLGRLAFRLGLHFETGAMMTGVGLGLSALGLAEALDGPALVAAWAVECVVLAHLAGRTAAAGEASAAERIYFAAAGFLVAAFLHVIFFEAPPTALLHGVDALGPAALGIGVCAAAALVAGRCVREIDPVVATAAQFACAAALVYLGSVAIVDSVGVSDSGAALQSGQVWLSVFWTVTGLGAVVAGLLRGSRSVRVGGLALLGLAIAKVWTYDLSELDEIARVLSFVGLGLLLLVGAFAYQRLRPREAAERAEAEA